MSKKISIDMIDKELDRLLQDEINSIEKTLKTMDDGSGKGPKLPKHIIDGLRDVGIKAGQVDEEIPPQQMNDFISRGGYVR